MWSNEKERQITTQPGSVRSPLTDICEEGGFVFVFVFAPPPTNICEEEGGTRRKAEANYMEERSFDLMLRIEL